MGIDGAPDLDAAVIVALGCNDKGVWASCREALEAALARFRSEGIDVVARSSWWSSMAWPDPQDPPFLNGVVIVATRHDPHALMAALGRIEDVFGRQRSVRNAPSTLDLAERRFVMGPIAEIAPDWVHPHGGVAQALAASATVGRDAHPV